jgi:nicotinate-nucleotide pyrophosphorylase (carboxylating)
MKNEYSVNKIVKDALKEDIGSGDITTKTIVPGRIRAKAGIYAGDGGILAGLDVAVKVFYSLDKKIVIKKFVKDGAKVKKNQLLAEIKGKTGALLTGERTALNFLQHLSGIATLTGKYVDKIKPCKVKILDTRKTISGMRFLEKYAVKIGGGCNHRIGLYDMVMLKDNHLEIGRALCAPRHAPMKYLVQKLRRKIPAGMRIEVETKNLKEVKEAFEAGADVIMLDNMSQAMMRKAVSFIYNASCVMRHAQNKFGCNTLAARRTRPLIEASGNVTLKNVKAIAKTGVDWISVGRLTHSAPALDISMDIKTGQVVC